MSTKHNVGADEIPERKRQRKVMSLLEKVDVLDKLTSGVSASAIGRKYGVNKSTIRYILKNEAKIRGSVRASAPSSAKRSFVSHRDPILEKMENALCVWVEDETQKGMSLSGAVVKEKAMRLYKHYDDSEGAQKGLKNLKSGWAFTTSRE
uniref:putative CENPB DNA-binding domain-containing protein 1 n=1 Tax=Myxine glutinosa TaxID=7769 RepID=UPI00358EFEB0